VPASGAIGPQRRAQLGGQQVAAIQTYARLGFQPDTIEILEFGLARKLIGDDDFSQELALGLPLVPRHLQAGYAHRLEDKNTAFGAEALALTLVSGS
jgi:hypothetical protein